MREERYQRVTFNNFNQVFDKLYAIQECQYFILAVSLEMNYTNEVRNLET